LLLNPGPASDCSLPRPQPSFSLFILEVLGFELKALSLLDKGSASWFIDWDVVLLAIL
jgi:hypothetical protein